MTSHSEKLSKDKEQACNITVKTSTFPLIISSYLEEMSDLHNDIVERLLFKAAEWSPQMGLCPITLQYTMKDGILNTSDA